MWPGVDVELLQTKFSSGSEEQQKSWLDHSTIPTSWLVAFFVYKVNFKFGNRSDRTVAWKAMSAILAALLAGIGQFSIPHARFGDGANVDLVVDTQGHVQFSDIWTTQFYTSQARRWWTKDRGDSGKPWVSVEFAAGHTVPLLDIIVFLLDPQHSRQFQDRVRGVVLPLLTHVAGVLDDNVKSLSSQSNARGPSRKRKRISTILVRTHVEQAATRIWNRTDLWQQFQSTETCLFPSHPLFSEASRK